MGNDGVRWRLGFGGSAVRQVTLCVGGDRVTMGLPPHTPLGDFIPKTHLRFAAVKSSFRVPAVRQVTLRSLTVFSLFRFALGDDWAAAQTCLREFFSQTPISASRLQLVSL